MNTSESQQQQLITWLKDSAFHTDLLTVVARLSLPDCYIAAGFVRNLVWDKRHGLAAMTPLNDVDVVYFDDTESDFNAYLDYEAQLRAICPHISWQVRNQALMHHRNGDRPYHHTLDAMSFWPEYETAVAARISAHHQYEVIAAFGFASLFDLSITPNPERHPSISAKRIHDKDWLTRWPKLTVKNSI